MKKLAVIGNIAEIMKERLEKKNDLVRGSPEKVFNHYMDTTGDTQVANNRKLLYLEKTYSLNNFTTYKNMKNEDLRFSVYVESHNDQGEKQRTVINSSCKRSDVLKIAESLGINLNYNSPYQMKKEKMYLIEKPFIGKIWERNFVAIGEFIHEPLLCIKRID